MLFAVKQVCGTKRRQSPLRIQNSNEQVWNHSEKEQVSHFDSSVIYHFYHQIFRSDIRTSENVIIVQMDPLVQEVWDTARKITCSWEDSYEKSIRSVLGVWWWCVINGRIIVLLTNQLCFQIVSFIVSNHSLLEASLQAAQLLWIGTMSSSGWR